MAKAVTHAPTDPAALVVTDLVQRKRRPQWRTVFTVGALGVVAGLLR